MRSFISNFRDSKPNRAHIVLVLGLCLLFCLAVEGVTTYFFGRVSRIEKRRETEFRAALALQSARARHKTSVLVAGNSLLLLGVDFPQLQRELGPDVELHRSVFENTFYYDWYYGLRRIFRAGSRPDVVVLVLSASQLISEGTDGDYSVQMLVDNRDLLRYADDTQADRNRMSVLALDRASFFFGTRAEIRSWLLNKILPDLPTLTAYFRFKGSMPGKGETVTIASRRLDALRQICQRHGVQLVLAIPPVRDDSGADAEAIAAAARGVPVVVPMAALPDSDFGDHIHLNPQGAVKFTSALAQNLRRFLLPAVPATCISAAPQCWPNAAVPETENRRARATAVEHDNLGHSINPVAGWKQGSASQD